MEEAENSFVKAMYSRIYFQILRVFIKESSDERMRKVLQMNNKMKLKYRAEARFMRALSYYHAMDLFGNVLLG